MPLARLRAALPAAALSLLLLTGCTATDDGVTPESAADTSASVSTMPITSTPSVDAAATSRAAHAAEGSRAAEASRSAGPTAPAAPADVEGDWIWVVPDDAEPAPETLSALLDRVRARRAVRDLALGCIGESLGEKERRSMTNLL